VALAPARPIHQPKSGRQPYQKDSRHDRYYQRDGGGKQQSIQMSIPFSTSQNARAEPKIGQD
jgi:hypothetical protein